MFGQAAKVMRNVAWMLFGQFCGLVSNAIALALLARSWGADTFGLFSYSLVFVGFFALLADFGMKPILWREMARKRDQAGSWFGTALLLKLLMAAAAVLLANVGAIVLHLPGRIRMFVFLLSWLILVSTKIGSVRTILDSIFQVDLNAKLPVLFQWVDSAVQVLAIAVMVKCRARENALVIAFVLSSMPGLLLSIFCTRRRLDFRVHFDRGKWVWLVRESFPLFVYVLLGLFYERMDVLLLQYHFGEKAVGVYSGAFRLTAPLVFIPTAVAGSLYPVLSKYRSDHPGLFAWLQVGLKILAAVGMGIGLFGVVFGRRFILWLFGRAFEGAVRPFQMLLLSQCFMFPTFLMVDFHNARNRQKINVGYIGVLLILSLFVQNFCIVRGAELGAAWAKLVLNTTGLMLLFCLSLPHFNRTDAFRASKTIGIVVLFAGSSLWALAFANKTAVYVPYFLLSLFGLALLFSQNDWRRIKELFMHRLKNQPLDMV